MPEGLENSGPLPPALRQELPGLHGTLLDIGCGYMPYKPLVLAAPSRVTKYIGLDFKSGDYPSPDLEWDGQQIPLGDASVDCAMDTEVFEHCPEPELLMREIRRVLKPGGVLFLQCHFYGRCTMFRTMSIDLRHSRYGGICVTPVLTVFKSARSAVGMRVWRR